MSGNGDKGGHKQENPEDEDLMEKELAEDAVWKRIQRNTFTRWANEHLKTVNKHIENLECDLEDGLRVISLVEVLSGKRMPKHNRRPTMRAQKLENVNIALKFLTATEGIKIVNIGSVDVIDGNLKLILGLIWTLILHYSISMPMWEGEDDSMYGQKGGPTPKQRLLGWINNKIPEVPVANFSKDWNSGIAIGALVDALAPGLCPDWPDWKPADALKNTQEAMKLATDWLDLPQLIKPEDVVNPKVDELSMMTYLSQFPNAKLKEGAPLRPRSNPNRVRCYGAGIQPTGVVVGAPTHFTVETFSAGQGKVEVFVQNSQGKQEPVTVKFNEDRSKTYTCTYTAKMEGPHKVSVKFNGVEVPKSPFSVAVEGVAGDHTKVTAKGPGIEPKGVQVNKPTYFDISTKGAGLGQIEVIILDPQGKPNTVPIRLRKTSDEEYRCEYVSQITGPHTVNVLFAGKQIPKGPFAVDISPACDPRKVRATGRGLQPTGVRVGDIADFKVFTEGAGPGQMDIKVTGPNGSAEKVNIKKINDFTYECDYKPAKEGKYVVTISYGSQEIFRSPFEVAVGPHKESKIVAYGPGLRGGVVDYPACFTVDTNGETGTLGFSVEGPSQAKIECKDNGDGSANVKYFPTAPGEYAIHILSNGDDIPKSPYVAEILPKTDYFPENVTAKGPGLEPNGVVKGAMTDFTIDTSKAGGHAPVDVTVMDKNYKQLPLKIKDNKDKTYKCEYKPENTDKHVVQVNYGGVAIPNSPFRVNVGMPSDASKVKIFGPGLEKGVKPQIPTHFNIDCESAGVGKVTVSIKDEKGREIPVQLNDNGNSTYSVDYTVPAPGNYKVMVTYDGKPVPGCPVTVPVTPMVDASKVKVEGLDPCFNEMNRTVAVMNSLQQFRVITGNMTSNSDISISITSPFGRKVKPHVIKTAEGCLANFVPSEGGQYLITVSIDGVPQRHTPHHLYCVPQTQVPKVHAFGPGLSRAKVNEIAAFEIEAKEKGNVAVTVDGPREVVLDYRNRGDGICSVAYVPTVAGYYTINIIFNGEHILGSPFAVVVDVDLRNIRVYGNGVDSKAVFIHTPTEFTIDSRALQKKSEAQVTCTITNPKGSKTDAVVKPMNDGTYKVAYTPFEEGLHSVNVHYDGQLLPGSPFKVNASVGCNPGKVKAYGSGLERGVVNQKNQFTIETKGAGMGALGLSIEGPMEAEMTCRDNKDGTCTVEYLPTEVGEYEIGVKYAKQDIPGSPFKVPVDAAVDPSKVKAHGPGIEPSKCRAGPPLTFTVDAKKSGKAPLTVDVTSDKGPIPFKPEIVDNNDGTYDVSYIPPPEGSQCNVKVAYAGKDIPGSPYKMKVKPMTEPQNVKLAGPGIEKSVLASIPTEFTIDAKDAGYGKPEVIIKSSDGSKVKTKIINKKDGTYKVKYTTHDVGEHKISVKFGGKEVTKSPFTVNSVATGNAEKCKISQKNIHDFATYAPSEQLHEKCMCTCHHSSEPEFITWIALNAENNDTLKEKLEAGEEYCVTVNAKDAGKGAVTCKINNKSKESKESSKSKKQSKKTVEEEEEEEEEVTTTVRVVDNKDGTYNIYYKVAEDGDYEMNIKYGGQEIKQGCYKFNATKQQIKTKKTIIKEESTTYEEVTTSTNYRQVQLFNLPVPASLPQNTLVAFVKMPSGATDKATIIDNHDGTVSLKYDPKEEGLHELHIKYNNEHIQGSPFKFHVDSTSSGYVTAAGPGLTHGIAGEPCPFKIYTKGAGVGGLHVAVEGPSKAEITCNDNKDGTVSVSYLPPAPGEYRIVVRFGGKDIKGSPFTAKVTGEGRKRTHISVGHASEVSLSIQEKDIKMLNASIESPSGLEEPCFLKKLANNQVGVSFTPREAGEHMVNVKRDTTHINGSPFRINVLERDVGDASKVKIIGNAVKEGKTHSENSFTINTKEAGFGGLSLSIEGPSKAEIQCKDNGDGTMHVSYKPTEPGYYIINLKFADHHVPGSPFTVMVTGQGSNIQRENIKKQREAASVSEVGSECKLMFKMPETSGLDMSAKVVAPSGFSDDAEILDLDDCLYCVKFVPKEAGVHVVSVRYKDVHIPGSPFQFTVGPLRECGAHRVHAGGPGLERGVVNEPCEFNVWTREAGPGSLSLSAEGPSKALMEFKDRKDGSSSVVYKVTEPGEYRIGIKFNDQHIPDSPFRVWVMPQQSEAKKIELRAIPPDSSLQVNKPVTIIINMNGARGQLDSKVISPTGAEDDCFITEIDRDEHALRFIPKENGVHQIQIRYNGIHIRESPLRLRIGRDEADPAAVHASGPGLGDVKTGKKYEFTVDTCSAGHGHLAVAIDGPSKVSLNCVDCEEGYKVNYTPLAPGEYFITVKYNGNHIVGSPFRVKCSGDKLKCVDIAPETSTVAVDTVVKIPTQRADNMPRFRSDASKATCKGMGLKKATVGRPNTFTVNCASAGTNMLFVALYGPKGPCDEVQNKHLGGNLYNVTYNVKEKGDYVLIIKWGDDHIPGSPFKVVAS